MAISYKIGIEIPILFIFYSFMLSDFVTTNFIIYRTCYVTLQYNETECALLGTSNATNATKVLETKVQPVASIMMMSKTILDALVTVFCSLIVGPWSNKHGRKPILLSSLFGYFVAFLFLMVICFLKWASPWWMLVSSVIASTGGGICSLLTVSFCYITDTSSEENRGLRMGFLEICFSLGALLGTVSSSYIFQAVGYFGIYCICAAVTFFSVIFTYFLITESVTAVEHENALRDLFDKSVIINTIKICLKRRQNMDRLILGLLMSLLIIFIFVTFSDSAMFFLWVREQFNWSLKKYTLYAGVNSLIEIFATIFMLVVIHKWLKVTDLAIILFGFTALSTSSLIYGFAKWEWMVYLGSGIKRLSCAVSPLGRSAISKLLPPEDLGHVFAVTTSLETLVQLISSPLYTLFYNNTLAILPAAFNFLSAAIYSLNIFITCAVILVRRLYPNPDIRVISNE